MTKAWFSSGSRICAKFEKFQAEDELEETNTTPSLPEKEDGEQEEDDRLVKVVPLLVLNVFLFLAFGFCKFYSFASCFDVLMS